MRYLRVAAIWAVVLLAVQLTLAAALGFAYQAHTQSGTAKTSAQLAPQVNQVRELQRQLAERIAVNLKLDKRSVIYQANSTSQNNWVGSLSACPLGSAAYADQYAVNLTGTLASMNQAGQEAQLSKAIRASISDLLPVLPAYSLDNTSDPRTIMLPSLHARIFILAGAGVQVGAAISAKQDGHPACFPVAQLPQPAPTRTPISMPGFGGEE